MSSASSNDDSSDHSSETDLATLERLIELLGLLDPAPPRQNDTESQKGSEANDANPETQEKAQENSNTGRWDVDEDEEDVRKFDGLTMASFGWQSTPHKHKPSHLRFIGVDAETSDKKKIVPEVPGRIYYPIVYMALDKQDGLVTEPPVHPDLADIPNLPLNTGVPVDPSLPVNPDVPVNPDSPVQVNGVNSSSSSSAMSLGTSRQGSGSGGQSEAQTSQRSSESPPMRSAPTSAYRTPVIPATPAPSLASGYLQDLERQRAIEGAVSRANLAERTILPGETPGESSSSRVRQWLDGESAERMEESPTREEGDVAMQDAPSPFSRSEEQEQPLGDQQQQEQHRQEQTAAGSSEQNSATTLEQTAGPTEQPTPGPSEQTTTAPAPPQDPQDVEIEDKPWDELTEEEKLRRDSAYRSRHGSVFNPRASRGG